MVAMASALSIFAYLYSTSSISGVQSLSFFSRNCYSSLICFMVAVHVEAETTAANTLTTAKLSF